MSAKLHILLLFHYLFVVNSATTGDESSMEDPVPQDSCNCITEEEVRGLIKAVTDNQKHINREQDFKLQLLMKRIAPWRHDLANDDDDVKPKQNLTRAEQDDVNWWLSMASSGGNVTGIEMALAAGAQLEYRHPIYSRRTPLLQATVNFHVPAMKYLLSHGADPNCVNSRRETPLHYVAAYGEDEMVKLLLETGAYVNVRSTGKDGETPLIAAARSNRASTARLLLEAGACLEATDVRGKTALYYAEIVPWRNDVKRVLEEWKERN